MSNTRIWVRRIHKWLGLLIGLQVVLWLSGGVVMSLIPIEMVRGEEWFRQDTDALSGNLSGFTLPLSRFSDEEVTSARPAIRLGQPVWFLQLADGSQRTVDAASSATLPALDAKQAASVARGAHIGPADVLTVDRVESADGEIRGAKLPLWRVQLDDRWNSAVYIDAITGRITAVRNDLWRVYDFFWMLHIMDYSTRDDFNNNLLRAAAGVGWFIGLSGIWMLFYVFRKTG
ncbi:MAG: hypothetical protein V2I26_02000 [Halieaceae bacterium]|jgi:hypothetical protein|nr:hypothetical protein [Halieaceae bacterium]